MTDVQPFDFQGREVRTVLVDGEPWFVAADVAKVLGYREAYYLTRGLDDDERGPHIVRTLGGDQEMTCVNEPGLYSAILRSRVPQAKAFKRWVTHEVLPRIRRTGQYGSQLPTSFAEALELAAAQQRQIETTEARAIEAERQIEADAPKVAAYERLMDADGYYSMEAAAKVLGIGRNTLFRMLRDDGVLLASNLPAQRYMHHFVITASSWTHPSTGVENLTNTTRVRPSGLAWLANRYPSAVVA